MFASLSIVGTLSKGPVPLPGPVLFYDDFVDSNRSIQTHTAVTPANNWSDMTSNSTWDAVISNNTYTAVNHAANSRFVSVTLPNRVQARINGNLDNTQAVLDRYIGMGFDVENDLTNGTRKHIVLTATGQVVFSHVVGVVSSLGTNGDIIEFSHNTGNTYDGPVMLDFIHDRGAGTTDVYINGVFEVSHTWTLANKGQSAIMASTFRHQTAAPNSYINDMTIYDLS